MSRPIYLLSPIPKEGTIALPMICFSLTAASIDLSACDVLMFTSKQAVKSAEAINPRWKEIPALAIGSATAKQISALGGTVLYQPSSFYGKTLSQDIVEKFSDKKILYLRPKIVSFDSKSFLQAAGVAVDEKIIYETSCIVHDTKAKPQKDAIIIFTSPSTIHCFFKSFTWDESYTAVVIGEATREHLAQNIEMYVADEATIDACIEKAREIIPNYALESFLMHNLG